jgi:hypothetical protein
LVKVDGKDVHSPKEASRLIKEGPRPLPLLFYVPNTDVVTAEGEHMVKYDTKETVAPNSAKEWKPKYVVIGGIIAQPWMMNMYRSKVSNFNAIDTEFYLVLQSDSFFAFLIKSEYDIAVIETQARRPVSVKVKQFSLQGGRIQNDWQGPQMVKYKNKIHPWKYIVVLPIARNPIKISSPNLSQLKPVHEGIRRVLLAQQRGRSGGSQTGGPARNQESYDRGGADRASSQRSTDGDRSQRSVGSGNNSSQRPAPAAIEQPDLLSQDVLSGPPPPPPQQMNGGGYAAAYPSTGAYGPPPPSQQQQPTMPPAYYPQMQPPPPPQPAYPQQHAPPQPMGGNGFYGPPGAAQPYVAPGYGPPQTHQQPPMPPQQPQQMAYPSQQYGY